MYKRGMGRETQRNKDHKEQNQFLSFFVRKYKIENFASLSFILPVCAVNIPR